MVLISVQAGIALPQLRERKGPPQVWNKGTGISQFGIQNQKGAEVEQASGNEVLCSGDSGLLSGG